MLRFVGIKYPLDGGVEGGRMSWPYRLVPGEQTNAAYRGVLLLPPGGEDEYVEGLRLIADAGLQAQTHAVGDETIDLIVRAYERVNKEKPIRPSTGRSCICFTLGRGAEKDGGLGIAATMQDHPVLLGHNQRRWWGDEQPPMRSRSARRSMPACWSAAAPTGRWCRSIRPVDVVDDDAAGAQGLHARQGARDHRQRGTDPLYDQQCAHQGVEKDRGSIETGKLADLAVLSQDILSGRA